MTNAPWQHRPDDMPEREYPFATLLDTPRPMRLRIPLTPLGWIVVLFVFSVVAAIYELLH